MVVYAQIIYSKEHGKKTIKTKLRKADKQEERRFLNIN
jgi:hypothetical protein